MKQQSQSNELTGSLIASESVTTPQSQITPPPANDFMYNWIRSKSGK